MIYCFFWFKMKLGRKWWNIVIKISILMFIENKESKYGGFEDIVYDLFVKI